VAVERGVGGSTPRPALRLRPLTPSAKGEIHCPPTPLLARTLSRARARSAGAIASVRSLPFRLPGGPSQCGQLLLPGATGKFRVGTRRMCGLLQEAALFLWPGSSAPSMRIARVGCMRVSLGKPNALVRVCVCVCVCVCVRVCACVFVRACCHTGGSGRCDVRARSGPRDSRGTAGWM